MSNDLKPFIRMHLVNSFLCITFLKPHLFLSVGPFRRYSLHSSSHAQYDHSRCPSWHGTAPRCAPITPAFRHIALYCVALFFSHFPQYYRFATDFTFPRWIVIKGRGRQTIPDTALWSTANESYLFVENGDDGSVFGNFLSIICEREGKPVPRIISSAIEYLEAHLLTVGIFRISGSQADMQDLKQKFNSGSITGFSNYPHNENDVHTIAGLLKAFIRELKDPLIPLSIYKELITIGGLFLSAV